VETVFGRQGRNRRDNILRQGLPSVHFSAQPDRGVIENNVSTDGQIAINRQIDVRELRVNAHTIVCGRSAITNRVRASVWAFTHALANVDLAVETLFSITPVSEPFCHRNHPTDPSIPQKVLTIGRRVDEGEPLSCGQRSY